MPVGQFYSGQKPKKWVSFIPALTPAGQRNPFLDNVSTQVSAYETLLHLEDGSAKRLIRQIGLAHPAMEVSSLEDASQAYYIT